MGTSMHTRWALLASLALTATSCFRSGGGGGGGCGLSTDGGIDALLRTYAGTRVETVSGRAEPTARATTVTVTRQGPRSVRVDLRGCSITAEVDGCVVFPAPGQTCSVDLGLIRLTGGTLTFGDGTLSADLRWTYSDGGSTGTFEYRFTSAAPSNTSASCREACDHGRRLGCSQCLRSTCEADCEARWSSSIYIDRMLATEACDVEYGDDTAAQCDRP